MKYEIRSTINDLWYTKGRFIFSNLYFVLAKLFKLAGSPKRAFQFCSASLRYGMSDCALHLLQQVMSDYELSTKDYSSGVEIKEASGRTIVLRWPSIEEGHIDKGILAIKFTKTFSYYLKHIDIKSLEKYFFLVLEPSWSGYADADILGFVGRANNIVVQASELEDRILLNSFPETFVAASFGASDWVDYRLFNDLKTGKIYDSIYVANTNPIKRVRRYLEAVSRIVRYQDEKYIGCLVCASWGGAEDLVKKLIESYQLNDNLIVHFSVGRAEVVNLINQSKVNVLLSYKEGSNKSLFEAMFCNTPVICLAENVGVNKSYINESTGLLISDSLIESSLLWIKKNYSRFQPRQWAMNNITPNLTTKKLESIVCSLEGVISTRSLLVKTNNPEYSYFDYPKVKVSVYSERLLRMFDNRSDVNAEAREVELMSLKKDFLDSL